MISLISKENIIGALKKCMDPEIRMDVWTLGLVRERDIEIKGNNVHIRMIPTTPFCPYLSQLKESMIQEIKKVKDVGEVEIDIDLEAKWEPSEEVRIALGI
ncbi:MAG TPA: metal-sulfur cluster assembly factor [archaeon]|nr:metal-sulfur cluster assembly factor [archaeon]